MPIDNPLILKKLYIVASEGSFYRSVDLVTDSEPLAYGHASREDQSVYRVDVEELFAWLLHTKPWRRRLDAEAIITLVRAPRS